MIHDLYEDREVERLDREALKALQLLRLKKTVATAPDYSLLQKQAGGMPVLHQPKIFVLWDDIPENSLYHQGRSAGSLSLWSSVG